MVIKRGDIFYADLRPVVGSEQGGIRPVLSFDEWRSMDPARREAEAVARVDALEPTWLGTDLASALPPAAEALVEVDTEFGAAPRRCVLVSDPP